MRMCVGMCVNALEGPTPWHGLTVGLGEGVLLPRCEERKLQR